MAQTTIQLIQVGAPNFERLAELVNIAKGTKRSMAVYAKECGVNPSTLSRIVNRKITKPLGIEMLVRLYKYRDEQTAITQEDFFKANGMVTEEEYEKIVERTVERSTNNIRENFKRISGIMTTSLFERNIGIRGIADPTPEEQAKITSPLFDNSFRPSLAIQVDHDEKSFRWHFYIVPIIPVEPISWDNARRIVHDIIRNYALIFLRDAWGEPELQGDDRTSIVIADKLIYDLFVKATRRITFNQPITAILVDPVHNEIREENLIGTAYGERYPTLFALPRTIINAGFGQTSMFDECFTGLEHNIDIQNESEDN